MIILNFIKDNFSEIFMFLFGGHTQLHSGLTLGSVPKFNSGRTQGTNWGARPSACKSNASTTVLFF